MKDREYYTLDGKVVDPWIKEGYIYGSCDFSLDYIDDKRWDIMACGIRRILEDFNHNPEYNNTRIDDVRVVEENGRLEIHFRGEAI